PVQANSTSRIISAVTSKAGCSSPTERTTESRFSTATAAMKQNGGAFTGRAHCVAEGTDPTPYSTSEKSDQRWKQPSASPTSGQGSASLTHKAKWLLGSAIRWRQMRHC